jgi:SAM-dependent methyltransferase
MSMITSNYWVTANNSSHRGNSDGYYEQNAAEHASLFTTIDAGLEGIDLGCGTGKLLKYYSKILNCRVGLDISPTMLQVAREDLGDDVNLINSNPFDYLPNCKNPIWITCGALNQYLDNVEIKNLLLIFKNNEHAKSFYLFETICPIRYRLFGLGISYRKPVGFFRKGLMVRFKDLIRRFIFSVNFMIGKYSKGTVYLGTPIMGYAYLPIFWHKLASDLDLKITILGSRFYEYRYHVILTKE